MIKVLPGFVVWLCFLYYLSPWRLFLWFVGLSILHELGHIAALCLFGTKIYEIRLTAFGACIFTEPMRPTVEAVGSLCGPIMNFLFFAGFRRLLPGPAILSLVIGSYNSLPVYPLDGGRALRAALSSWLSPREATMAEGCVSSICVGLLAAGSVLLRGRVGLVPLLVSLGLLGRMLSERNSCCDFARMRI